MALNTLSLSELRDLSPEERDRRVASFMAARNEPANGEIQFLGERIREFEVRYEMSSATMLQRFRSHAIPETAEICRWLILLDAKNALEKPTEEPRPL
jgi:hypothetical protein